ncbi:hypothetical protein HMSSN036_06780 [Paenibacillus macerans]|nr:hypothetical protein HMSSN036_06780 [Paenibacillus macerans]
MEIHLIDGAGNDFYFPVNPDEISISRGKALETVNILSLGEYDFPAGEKVKEIAFSSFFRRFMIQDTATMKISPTRRRR